MMRTLFQVMLVLPGLVGFTADGDQQERQKKQLYAVSPGGTLEVHLASGNIRIGGWDRNEVLVQTPDFSEEQQDQLRISRSGTTLRIEYWGGGSHDGDVTIRVSVPAKFNVSAETGGGNIEIRGPLNGEIAGATAGGEVRLVSLGGTVRMSTSGGDIDAGDIEGTLELSSMGGEIHTGTVSGKTEISTGGGDVEVERAKNDLDISTAGGNIRVGDVGGTLSAFTAGGDIEIRKTTGHISLNTAGGSVSVGSAPKGITVRTAGGDLALRNIGGMIEAKTGGGNIEVSFAPGTLKESRISTGAGDIRLLIPPGLKATVKVEIRGSGYSDQQDDQVIQSDFKVESRTWDDRTGAFRATIQLNGGGEDVVVVTGEGLVRIVSSKKPGK